MRETSVLRTIELTYAAALEPDKWGAALTSIADLLGGFDATLEVHATAHPIPLSFMSGDRIPADGISDYLAYFSKVCPRLIGYESLHKAGDIGFDYDFITEKELDKDEFYTDFLAPGDLRYYLSGTLAKNDRNYADLYVHRTRAQGHVDEEEISLMRRLLPHVAAAFDIHQRLNFEDGRRVAMEAALEMAEFGTVFLNGSGAILFANSAARNILSAGDGISILDNKLAFSDSSTGDYFDRILQAMFGRSLASQWEWGDDIHVRRRTAGQGYIVSVRRMPEIPIGVPIENVGAAVVFIADPLSPSRLAKGALIAAYGLTEAEADVAAAFANLGSLPRVAEIRQVSMLTVQTQLKHVMHKLDVHSQAELMRLLLTYRRLVN